MRKSNHFIVLAALASLLLLEMAFAREKNQAALNLTETVQVGSAQLKPGNYKLEWQGDGPTVQVRIFQEHKLVATAPGKFILFITIPCAIVPGLLLAILGRNQRQRALEELSQ